jgi:hypothetical protein
MVISPALLINPLVYAVYFLINGISIFYISKQETSDYRQLKGLLISIQLLFISIVVLEVGRSFTSDTVFMTVYTIGNTTFVLVDVVLLTLVALTVYLRPRGSSIREVISEMNKHPKQQAFFWANVAYIALAEAAIWVFRPFGIVQVNNLAGAIVAASNFTDAYLAVLFGVLLIFVAYPSTLLFLARRRTKDPAVRRALLVLPIIWAGIGLDLLIFEGYLIGVGIDASALGYLIAASAFSVSALVFRRATVLSGFFEPIAIPAGQRRPTRSELASLKVGVDVSRLIGRNMLLEVDPAAGYEKLIRALALELVAEEYVVFTFTSKGSPVYVALSDVLGARFYTFSEKVSYPRPGSNQYEVLVPRNDQSILLNVLDKTLKTNPNLKMVVIFDSISDMILSSSFESSYKFLKQANELIGTSGKTAMFLVTKSAHGEREANIVRSLFTNQLSYDSNGLQLSKFA